MKPEEHTTHEEHTGTEIVEVEDTQIVESPSQKMLSILDLSDLSQFLYKTNYGGKQGQEFTAEGVKTIGLQNGISTGKVKIEFLNDEKTEALFYCTATDQNGDTSERVVKQCEMENGRINPTWIEKGIARAERNAIKARLPIGLFKTALQKAITAGEAKESEIIKSQKELATVWDNRDDSLSTVKKSQFYKKAQEEYGESVNWEVDTWKQVTSDLSNLEPWVKELAEIAF